MGRPKMLLPWGGTTVLGQVVGTYAAAGICDLVVVTGAEQEKIEQVLIPLAAKYPVRSVRNRAYQQGEMLSSLQCGLMALEPDTEAALIGLGDQPQLEAAAVLSILAAFDKSDSSIIVPSYRMRRGHPWLVRKRLWGELLALQTPHTPRDFLNAHAAEIEYVPVDTPAVLEDLDTLEDYQRHL